MSHLETKATMTMSGLHKATQAPETQYYDMSDSSPGLSPPGTVQTYDSINTPQTLIGRSPPPPPPGGGQSIIRNILVNYKLTK